MKESPSTPLLELYKKEVISKFAPGFAIKWKSESLAMKILGFISFWNPGFMTNVITTLGDSIYVPDSWLERNELSNLTTVAHEAVHVQDAKKNPLMGFLYLVPQVLFPILAVGLAFVSPWFLFVALLGLLPLPAPFRFWYELRGYRMNLLIIEKVYGWAKTSQAYKSEKKWYVSQMTDKWYYFAMPFKGFVEKKFDETGWETEEIYQETLDFCKRHVMV
jgi:hypothetical protein